MRNQAATLEAQRVAMYRNPEWGMRHSSKASEKAASSSGTQMWAKGENSETAKENGKIAVTKDEAQKLQALEMKMNASKKVSSSNDQPSEAERTNVLTQSEEQTTDENPNKVEDEEEQEQRSSSATRLRFGSLTLAEAENFSVWRGKLSL